MPIPSSTIYRDSAGQIRETPPADGTGTAMQVDRDTDGNPVPTYKAHSYTYDGSGNLATDTVSDGTATWIRTYMWANGAQTSDSGWVKQNG